MSRFTNLKELSFAAAVINSDGTTKAAFAVTVGAFLERKK